MNLAALASALSGAIANVAAGAAARRVPPHFVLLVASPISLVLIIPVILIIGGSPTIASLVWGLIAGVAAGLGLSLAFVALGRGPVGAVTASIASTSTVLLTIVGIASGDPVTPNRLLALTLCLLAIVLVTYVPGDTKRARFGGPALGVLVGIAFGTVVSAFAQVDKDEGLWPLLPARLVVVMVAIVVAVFVRRRQELRHASRDKVSFGLIALIVVVAIFDVAANVSVLIAFRFSDITTVALNASVSPIFAAILGAVFLRERLRPIQLAGLLLAVAGSVLVALG